ncbi:Uncharacterized protein LHYA1_G005436 [Lachnellula hyalina]|uniref:Large ribosomal subunit protein mL67 n=1 Tax=Lachnellula hyalina TaxID=1316788 RepID=A0A8H8R0P0_9HELO|nr:Uncharacterized protein LHYA1_G005436 [Lachnellula hyalina]TVY26338.1 Uncharacterized protein LHYA1_G005436 [Lachnellula hyalina]
MISQRASTHTMNVRPTTDLARHAILVIRGARHASTAPEPPKLELGRQIFVYNHLQRNHVVYSLTKTLKNHKSLRQIPFNGKKTVPRALRKDHWTPLATLTFPSPTIGISALQRLREFRRRHELEWSVKSLFPNEKERTDYLEGAYVAEGKYKGLSEKQQGKKKNHVRRKMVGWKLMDQKPNSVADMAFVCSRLDAVEVGKEKGTRLGLHGEGTGAPVEVLWNNMLDAEYAETWSGNVVHGPMQDRRPQEVLVEEVEEQTSEEKVEPVKEQTKKPENIVL